MQGWLTKSQDMPSLIWSDAGTGGKKGSIWAVNKVTGSISQFENETNARVAFLLLLPQMGLLHVVDGHDCPSGEFFELKVGRCNPQKRPLIQ